VSSTATTTRSPLLSYEEAATRCGPSFKPRQVKWWASQGWLTPVRIGQRTFVRQDELDQFLEDAHGAPHPRSARKAAGT
jgi:hypothetical protein